MVQVEGEEKRGEEKKRGKRMKGREKMDEFWWENDKRGIRGVGEEKGKRRRDEKGKQKN